MSQKKQLPLNPLQSPSLKNWGEPLQGKEHRITESNVVVACGWGRLIFAHTFRTNTDIADILKQEQTGERDLAIYLRDPHVVLAKAPQQLFLDPSHTYRLWLAHYHKDRRANHAFTIQEMASESDVESANVIYQKRHMVPLDKTIALNHHDPLTCLVAKDNKTGQVIGTMMAVDHVKAFSDPDNGASLWALAVDPQTTHVGVGVALVHHFAQYYARQGRHFIDVSVLHDNQHAIALYEKLGFERVPVFCVKNKNAINENLYIAPEHHQDLNPYATIITNEARRRGIEVEVLDAEGGFFRLKYGGRSIICRESLCELTSAIAMSRCAEKDVTHNALQKAGLQVSEQMVASSQEKNYDFLKKHKEIVVKPAHGEQGAGITLPVITYRELDAAIKKAGGVANKVILEKMVAGQDLRIVVINYKVVAAAIRKPPFIVGDGHHRVKQLIEKLSRRREAATGGESSIALDAETENCINRQGYSLKSILEKDVILQVRKTANLHTGGTIHDVTAALHPTLAEAAVKAARALEIPVVGLDLMVTDVSKPDYVIIEANERPGLANHDPQPTAERFVDLLFPHTAAHDTLEDNHSDGN